MAEKTVEEHIAYQERLGYKCQIGMPMVLGKLTCTRLICSKSTALSLNAKVLVIMPDGQLMFGCERDD